MIRSPLVSSWVSTGTTTCTYPKIYLCNGTSTSATTFYQPWSDCTATSATSATSLQYTWYDDGCTAFHLTNDCGWEVVYQKPLTEEQKKKKFHDRISGIIQSRCAPNIITRKGLGPTTDIREQRARETLRRVIGDDKYTNFLKCGFISIRGKSGLVYQIFPDHGITKVFDKGNLVERLCVVLRGSFPPTDSLIMRYLLILNNEQQFRSLAIKHSICQNPVFSPGQEDTKSLVEIFKELKVA